MKDKTETKQAGKAQQLGEPAEQGSLQLVKAEIEYRKTIWKMYSSFGDLIDATDAMIKARLEMAGFRETRVDEYEDGRGNVMYFGADGRVHLVMRYGSKINERKEGKDGQAM